MSDGTDIEYVEATWNFITGCEVYSPGCKHCYAMKLAGTRLRHHPSRKGLTIQTANGPVWTGEVRFNGQWLNQPLQWRRARRIFPCAHSDLFNASVPVEWIDRAVAVMALAGQHTFLVLTKRAARMRDYWRDFSWERVVASCTDESGASMILGHSVAGLRRAFGLLPGMTPMRLPLPNVMLGVTVENQDTADERREPMAELARAGWDVWVSNEPALGFIDWSGWEFIAAMITGGESGDGARPMHPGVARAARDWCATQGIDFMFKQWGAWHTAAVNLSTGEPVFRQFESVEHWVAKAPTWVQGGIGLDSRGREMANGADMARARDEGTFPVVIMHAVGKARAGRMLDGRLHDQVPMPRAMKARLEGAA